MEVVCQMLDFETSNSKSEVSKSNSWKITSFSKLHYENSLLILCNWPKFHAICSACDWYLAVVYLA